ncbi:MAG: ATP-binding protein [Chloroflexota bacterium]
MSAIILDTSILVVDDDQETRELLIESLEYSGYIVDGVGSIDEGEEKVRINGAKYDVALVDLVLPASIDSTPLIRGGLELTRRFGEIEPEIKVAIFTGQGDQGILQQLKEEANTAGAYRLIIKSSGDALGMIEDLVKTVRQLNEIKAEIEETLSNRQWARGLLESLDVSLYIVDPEYKLWYADTSYQQLTEEFIYQLPGKQCWTLCHGSPLQTKPCTNCPVAKFNSTGDTDPTIMFAKRGQGFHYVQVSMTPLTNAQNETIATLVATQNITESPVVGTLPTVDRILTVLGAITSTGYDSTRVYTIDESNEKLEGLCESGSELDQPFRGLEIELKKYPDLQNKVVVETQTPYIYSQGELGEESQCLKRLKKEDINDWIGYPITTAERKPLGFLAVDNRRSHRPFVKKDLQFLQGYVDEVATVLSEEYFSNTREEIDNRMQKILQDLQAIGYSRARLYEVSPLKKRLMGRAEVGGGMTIPFERFSIFLHQDANMYDACIIAKRPKLIDVSDKSVTEITPFARQLGKDDVNQWIEFPLIHDEKGLVGHLCIDNKGKKDALLREPDFKMIAPKALELADILANDTTTRREPQPLIKDLDTKDTHLALTRDLDEGLDIVLQTAIDSVGSSSGFIAVQSGDELQIRTSHSGVNDIAQTLKENNVLGRLLVAISDISESIFLNELQNDKRYHDFWNSMSLSPIDANETESTESVAILPLEFHGVRQGIILLYSTSNSTMFSKALIDALDPICFRASLMIHEWRLAQTEEIQRAWDLLFTDWAHYLKTPLTTLKGSVERLAHTYRQQGDDPYYADVAEHEVNSLLQIVNEVFTLSKFSAGVDIINPRKGNASSVVRTVYNRIRFVAEEKSIEIQIDVPQSPIFVFWDTDRITEALYNIAVNAIQFSDEDQIVKVKCFVDGLHIHFEVIDFGIGISEEDMQNIFKKFWMKDRYSEGTGIGLTFAKYIIDTHHGDIHVDSTPGKGTSFSVVLPRYVKGTRDA